MASYRRATLIEIDAAVEVWIAANGTRQAPKHPARLRSWARLPGAYLAVAQGPEAALTAMGLALPGRAEDGVGDVIPGLTHLTGICVLPEEQGRGVGSRLLDHLLRVARATGHDRASLWASAENDRGQRFFQSRGFLRTGRVSTDGVGPELVHYEADLGATPQMLTPASKGPIARRVNLGAG